MDSKLARKHLHVSYKAINPVFNLRFIMGSEKTVINL
jgi:hypothetical protein